MFPSFFRQLRGFFLISLKMQLRTTSAIFFGFVFPLLFIGLFGLFNFQNSSHIRVGIVSPLTDITSTIQAGLLANNQFEVVVDATQNLQQQLNNNQIDVIIAQQDTKTVLLTIASSKETEGRAAQYIVEHVVATNTSLVNTTAPNITINTQFYALSSANALSYLLPGILSFAIISAAVEGTAFSFLTIRRNNVIKRIFSAPTFASSFILGQALARLCITFAQVACLLAFAIIVFGYTPRNGPNSIFEVLPIIVLGIILCLSMGYCIAALVKKDDLVSPILNVVIFPQLILSGSFFDISHFPTWLQHISVILPLYHLNQAFEHITVNGYHLWSEPVFSHIGYMVIWSGVMYYIAAKWLNIKETT